MPLALRHVISGILAGGIPGFRMGVVLLLSPVCMAWCVFVFRLFLCLFSCCFGHTRM